MSIADRLVPSPEVADALAAHRPIVALESTLISHGLPYPDNVAVARAAEAAVRASGASSATVAIHDGRILLGLTDAEIETLGRAEAGTVLKASRPNLSLALDRSGWAATTVSATMIAAAAAGIRVFATGGIGGVHRGALGGGVGPGPTGVEGGTPDALGREGADTTAQADADAMAGEGATARAGASAPAASQGPSRPPTLDISADLEELARTPIVVVCAGPKAILDLPLTLEYLETHGVPVVAIGQDEIPGFYSRGSGVRAPISVADEAAAARLVAMHLELGLGSGMLLCVPVPEADALPLGVASAAVDRATAEAGEAAIHGPALTPWLLARIAALTDGASVRANTALIENDARVAGRLAVTLAKSGGRGSG